MKVNSLNEFMKRFRAMKLKASIKYDIHMSPKLYSEFADWMPPHYRFSRARLLDQGIEHLASIGRNINFVLDKGLDDMSYETKS